MILIDTFQVNPHALPYARDELSPTIIMEWNIPMEKVSRGEPRDNLRLFPTRERAFKV